MNQLPKPAGLFGAGELLQLFRDFQPHTKAELSEWTGLSRSTITQRLESLIQLGLIHPASSAASTGGRPSAQLELDPFQRLIAAVDFGATHVSVAICTLDVRILAASERELSITEGPEVALAVMAEEVRKLASLHWSHGRGCRRGRDWIAWAPLNIQRESPQNHPSCPAGTPLMFQSE